MTTWKSIPGYEGLYEAGTNSKIRTLTITVMKGNIPCVRPGKIMKGCVTNLGYLKLNLYKDEKP